jgi:hypothetical protein
MASADRLSSLMNDDIYDKTSNLAFDGLYSNNVRKITSMAGFRKKFPLSIVIVLDTPFKGRSQVVLPP